MKAAQFAHLDLGLIDFLEAWDIQKRVHADILRGERPPTVITCSHKPVITTGNRQGLQDLQVTAEFLQTEGIAIVHTDRGGKLTAHEPGQLVVYPILPVGGIGVRSFVSRLETTVQELLATYGVMTTIDEAFPGVWVNSKKIAALGLRFKNHLSMHGLAINVANDLTTFRWIVPCGIANRGVTTLNHETGKSFSIREVQEEFLGRFANKCDFLK